MQLTAIPLPHDLLWGMTPAHLPPHAPLWAIEALRLGQPVVVRRAVVASGWVAVGIRGASREQRLAAIMPLDAIERIVQPEHLTHLAPATAHWPALHTVQHLRPLLDALGLPWGVTGSAGFELATGIAAVHASSDLDLILRAELPLSQPFAANLLAQLQGHACRVDLQVQTPLGAVALAELAGPRPQVLLKCAEGARLVDSPWQVAA